MTVTNKKIDPFELPEEEKPKTNLEGETLELSPEEMKKLRDKVREKYINE